MVGGQRNRIIDPARVEQREEVADLAVEVEKLQAHLLPFGAVGVADIIGRRQADREDIGRGPTPEPHLVDQAGGERQRAAVELGRCAERGLVARGAREPAPADRLAPAFDRERPAPWPGRRQAVRAARPVAPARRRPRHSPSARPAGWKPRRGRSRTSCRSSTSAGRRCDRSSSPRRGPCPRRRRCGSPASAPSPARRASEPADGLARPCSCSTSCRARARPRRNRRSCRSAARDWSIQTLAMIPVRAGWSPVRMVEWPGQVSVAAWL